jgi:acyl-CoA thioesterase-1
LTRRRNLWLTLVLVLAAGGGAAYFSASSGGTPVRALRVDSHVRGKPVNPAPGASVPLAWPTGRPLRVLFVGDSLTVGKYAVRQGGAFPALVTAALRARGRVTERVRARTGVTASYWASRPLPAADLVVLELGTNDFCVHLTPRAAFESDYARLVANVRAQSPHAQLLCLSLWRSSHYGYKGESLLIYNKAVARACRGGAFVWISALYDAQGTRQPAGVPTFLGTSDSFHPNDSGHRGIAKAIEQTLRLS